MEIRRLEAGDYGAALALAQEQYEAERAHIPALPAMDIRASARENLQAGTGFIAYAEGEARGFLAFGAVYESGRGERGAHCPLYGYGARGPGREKTLSRLFGEAARTLAAARVQNLRVSVYAHDAAALKLYVMSAFAMDLTDVVRETGATIAVPPGAQALFREMRKAEVLAYQDDLIQLYRGLINHLRESPVFYPCGEFLPIEARYADFLLDDMRIFAAFRGTELIGMVNAEPLDIDFLRDCPRAMGMGDLFVKPAHRDRGLGRALLAYANGCLARDGVERLFVTHGTINPTARGFWDEHFQNFSYSLERKIDPAMLGEIARV